MWYFPGPGVRHCTSSVVKGIAKLRTPVDSIGTLLLLGTLVLLIVWSRCAGSCRPPLPGHSPAPLLNLLSDHGLSPIGFILNTIGHWEGSNSLGKALHHLLFDTRWATQQVEALWEAVERASALATEPSDWLTDQAAGILSGFQSVSTGHPLPPWIQ